MNNTLNSTLTNNKSYTYNNKNSRIRQRKINVTAYEYLLNKSMEKHNTNNLILNSSNKNLIKLK